MVRGWAGVEIVPLNDVLARQFKVPDQKGALVNSVVPDSPAAEAGLRRGDAIVEVGGRRIASPIEFIKAVERTLPGKRVVVGLIRDGRPREIKLTVGERPVKPAETGEKEEPDDEEGASSQWEGARLQNATEALNERFRLPPGASGAVVTDVDGEGGAAEIGLQAGDLIVAINSRKVQDARSFINAARGAIFFGKASSSTSTGAANPFI